MLDPSLISTYLGKLTLRQLQGALGAVFGADTSFAERARTIETALLSPAGTALRAEIGRWIVRDIVPAEELVPEAYAKWRPPVRDAMLFVVSRLCAARLAPKLLEQVELPPDTPPELRLLTLIGKVPGLQKLGQVLARNRRLLPSLRAALSELENGIHDVTAADVRACVEQELGARMAEFNVKIEPAILSEASVSAVVRFSWRNPASGTRERGVFKVLKPHIPSCFAEDMEILQGLAAHFGHRSREYGFAPHVLSDTFTKVRRLLQHEVDFPREQDTLLHWCDLYRSIPGVRVPRLIQPLCAPTITAMSEERGVKVTDAVAHMSGLRRRRVADQLIEALVAVPLFATEADSMFHADPHAGNLLYDATGGELVLVDWALTERLSRDQRRHLALLFCVLALRDVSGVCEQVQALTGREAPRSAKQAALLRDIVAHFIDDLPLLAAPGAVDAMRLLETLAIKGVRFPAPLIMFSKVLFTLDGILEDIAGDAPLPSMSVSLARQFVQRWLADRHAFGAPLTVSDWMTVQCSGLLYGSRWLVQCEQALLNRLLPPRRMAAEGQRAAA